MTESQMGEFETLDFHVVGNDIVCFRLEDGTVVKVKVVMLQAGVSKTRDKFGNPIYNVTTQPIVTLVPKNKKYIGSIPPTMSNSSQVLPQDKRSSAT